MQKKAPPNGSKARLLEYRLTDGVAAVYLENREVQDKQSIAQNPTYLAIASQKHCEIDVNLSLSFKEADKSCCINRVIPRTTRQPNWNHVDRGNLVRHTVDTMMAVSYTHLTLPTTPYV